MPLFLCQEEHHNKFWEYSIDGSSVTFKWGRVGVDGQVKTKKFASPSAAQVAVQKKIEEKIGKGYKETTEQNLKQEVKTAQTLGLQYKISRMLFVRKKGNKLEKIPNYDPQHYCYVEILNSWQKDITRLLLSREESGVISGGVSEMGQTITVGNIQTNYFDEKKQQFIQAVRDVLKRLSTQVVEILKTVKFAAVGARKLFDDDEEATDVAASYDAVYEAIDMSGVDKQVVVAFAAMGTRTLDL